MARAGGRHLSPLDDDCLDPLAFNPDCALGVPGLLAAYRNGGVTLANAVGTGVADDKSTYPYVPDMIRFYLGEEPILQNVETYRCNRAGGPGLCPRTHRRAGGQGGQRSGGYGMLIGPKATKARASTNSGA